MRLLLVEDDTMIGEAVLDALRAEHYAVDWVRDGVMAQTALDSQSYDLMLLDLGLPMQDGLAVLRHLRRHQPAPAVLVATARDAVADRIAGLDAGADDYIVKPYDIDELLARVRALLRRRMGQGETAYQRLVDGRLVRLLASSHEASVDQHSVTLSAREWAVLEPLLARPGAVFSRAQLEEKLYSWKDEISSNAVEVYVHGLRKKLGADLIQTVRGLGYVIPRP